MKCLFHILLLVFFIRSWPVGAKPITEKPQALPNRQFEKIDLPPVTIVNDWLSTENSTSVVNTTNSNSEKDDPKRNKRDANPNPEEIKLVFSDGNEIILSNKGNSSYLNYAVEEDNHTGSNKQAITQIENNENLEPKLLPTDEQESPNTGIPNSTTKGQGEHESSGVHFVRNNGTDGSISIYDTLNPVNP